MNVSFEKNRDREKYSFANINLLGVCNAKCFFCLGRDIPHLLSKHNQTNIHFLNWQNFSRFIKWCADEGIKNIYLTGQNVDALQYHFFKELAHTVMDMGFNFGIRTNGLLAQGMIEELKQINGTIGYSIHTLNPTHAQKIMGWSKLPDYDYLLKNSGDRVRVSIVVNRYNKYDILKIIQFVAKYPAVKYIQLRRISTDTRQAFHTEDLRVYEELFHKVEYTHEKIGTFHGAEIFELFGKQVVFWRTVQTSVNSINYFTDGTLSGEYFVVEGYIKNYMNRPPAFEPNDSVVYYQELMKQYAKRCRSNQHPH